MNRVARRAPVALAAAIVAAGTVSCSAAVDCSAPGALEVVADVVDLAAAAATPAREGCDYELLGAIRSPDDMLWLHTGLSESGATVVIAHPLAEFDDVGVGTDVPPGVGVVDATGRAQWLRAPGAGEPGMSTWLADLTEDWVLWADGRSDVLAALDAEFWSADRRTGQVRRLGATSTDGDGFSRTAAGYNRPSIVGSWGFWVDVPTGEDAPWVVGAPLDGSSEPVVVGRGFMLAPDRCGPDLGLVFADMGEPGEGEVGHTGHGRLLRVSVDDDGPGPAETLVEVDLEKHGVITDVASCAEALAWAQERSDAGNVGTHRDGEATLDGMSHGNPVSTAWLDDGRTRTRVEGASSALGDLAVTPGFFAFSDVSMTDNSAVHYLLRRSDRHLLTAPTELGAGQVFEMAGGRASWLRPRPGSTAEEAMMDLTASEQVVVELLTRSPQGDS